MQEIRKFSVHPQMIYNLIKAQAGSLGKAVLENIMNSIDAQASTVTIDIDREKIVIKDDGHGFRSLQEIEDCFEVFGFPHEEGARVYGKFGIGRAQLWCFCSAVWHTNTFVMDVDIKNRGLDYQLNGNQPHVQGLTIESKFYTPMSTLDILNFVKELEELAMFAQIPVIVNGTKINKSPSDIKWDFETDDAYIKLSDKPALTVYNLGVLVRNYSSYQVGSGGLVVTKPGVSLSLNMARNDILVAECKVWSRIKPFIQQKSDDKVRQKVTKLSDDELMNRAQRFLSGELSYTQAQELKLFTDITSRGHSLASFLSQDRGPSYVNPVVTMAPEGSRLGERAHTTRAAFVLHPKTLARFGVDTVEDLKKVLLTVLDNLPPGHRPHGFDSFKRATFVTDLAVAVPALREGYEMVPHKEWTKQEKGVLSSLGKVQYRLIEAMHEYGVSEKRLAARQLSVGVSNTAHAWTDGVQRIVYDRATLARAGDGFSGFMHLVSLLTHEYLHEDSSSGTHIHDEMFYSRFHTMHNSPLLGELAFAAYRSYIGYLANAKIKPTKKLLEALTWAENLDAQVEDSVEVEAKSEAPALSLAA